MKKTIKILYGGDATKRSELSCGDTIWIDLLEHAIALLFPYVIDKQAKLKIRIPANQLCNIKPKKAMMGALFFLPVEAYKCNKKIQLTTISCGNHIVKIYTYRY